MANSQGSGTYFKFSPTLLPSNHSQFIWVLRHLFLLHCLPCSASTFIITLILSMPSCVFAHLNLSARPDYRLYVCHLASSSLCFSLSPALLLKWSRAFSFLSNFHELWIPTVQLGGKQLTICISPLLKELWKVRHWNLVRNTLFLDCQHEFLKLFWPPTVTQNYVGHTNHQPICLAHCKGRFLQWLTLTSTCESSSVYDIYSHNLSSYFLNCTHKN